MGYLSEVNDAGKIYESELLGQAQAVLSGKRIALVAFPSASATELSRIIAEVDGFTRDLPVTIHPSSDTLKPFEAILINAEHEVSAQWLSGEESANVVDRCIALGHAGALMASAKQSLPSNVDYCVWPASKEEILLRCVLRLRRSSQRAVQSAATNSNIVLADDDSSITALVRLTLQRNGLTCEVASNGREALELINKLKPCAAVLDVGMPSMDGFQVLSQLRSVPEIAQTRVILLTGCEQEADILRGFRLGADDYVIKPFNPMELLMRLKRVIGRL